MTDKQKVIQTIKKFLIARSSSFASILIWCPIVEKENTEEIAYTDGTSIYLGDKFFKFSFDIQCGIIVHEALHICFLHVDRIKKVRDIDCTLWNICTDAIINYAINTVNYLSLPQDCITFSSIKAVFPLSKGDREYSAESLYNELLSRIEGDKKEEDKEGNGNGESKEGKGEKKGKSKTSRLKDLLKKELSDLSAEDSKDLEEHLSEELKELKRSSAEKRAKFWEKNLQRAKGEQGNNIWRNLDKEFPKPKVDWRRVLRNLATEVLTIDPYQSYSRANKRMIPISNDIIYAGMKYPEATLKIGLVVDTSGSINDELLIKFMAEADAIRKASLAEVELVFADAEVCATYSVKAEEKSLYTLYKENKVVPKGGGGTDFRPAFEYLANKDIQLLIYLTDMAGCYPTKTYSFSTIWASIEQYYVNPPYGRVIHISNI